MVAKLVGLSVDVMLPLLYMKEGRCTAGFDSSTAVLVPLLCNVASIRLSRKKYSITTRIKQQAMVVHGMKLYGERIAIAIAIAAFLKSNCLFEWISNDKGGRRHLYIGG